MQTDVQERVAGTEARKSKAEEMWRMKSDTATKLQTAAARDGGGEASDAFDPGKERRLHLQHTAWIPERA